MKLDMVHYYNLIESPYPRLVLNSCSITVFAHHIFITFTAMTYRMAELNG